LLQPVLADGAREEGTASRGIYPWELWDWQWDRLDRPRLQQVGVPRDQDLPRFREIRTQIEVMKSEVMKLCRSTRLFLTPSSHSRKGRTGRGSTHSTCLIGGSQTVQRYQDSRTCSVQWWPTHPPLVRLSVSVESSMRLTMTIRGSLTPTTLTWVSKHSDLEMEWRRKLKWKKKRTRFESPGPGWSVEEGTRWHSTLQDTRGFEAGECWSSPMASAAARREDFERSGRPSEPWEAINQSCVVLIIRLVC
jgi:hypothetical protein